MADPFPPADGTTGTDRDDRGLPAGRTGAPLLPVVVAFAGIALALVLWSTLRKHELRAFSLVVAHDAEAFDREIANELAARVAALERMARRWELRGGTPRDEWEGDARSYLAHFPDLRAIEWVDPAGVVRWVVPLEDNRAAVGLDLMADPQRREALLATKATGRPHLSPVVELVQGGRGFLCDVPIGDGARHGCFVTVIEPETFFRRIADRVVPGYTVAVREDDRLVYRKLPETGVVAAEDFRTVLASGAMNRDWKLELVPTADLLGDTRTTWPEVVLAGGIALSLLLAGALHFARVAIAEHRAAVDALRRIEGLNAELEERVAARTSDLEVVNRELERSNADLGRFAYVASHDLKAPLRAILKLVGWLERDLGPDLDAESRENMDLLRNRAERMQRLLDDLLAYSRVGRADAASETVDTRAVAAECLDLLDPPPGFRVEIADDLPTITAPPNAIRQIFLNLIGNAIKHHDRPESGRVVIAATDGPDHHEFRIADDGPGIPPRYRERVFEMFHTLKRRDEVEASGMGLALVRRIVEHHGGTVRVESGGERGTTLVFTWPKDPARRDTGT